MGITIDSSIRLLEDYHKWEKQYGIFGSGVDDATNKLLEVAKKYQKIKHIINDVPYLDRDEYKIASIKEIIDRNDDK